METLVRAGRKRRFRTWPNDNNDNNNNSNNNTNSSNNNSNNNSNTKSNTSNKSNRGLGADICSYTKAAPKGTNTKLMICHLSYKSYVYYYIYIYIYIYIHL